MKAVIYPKRSDYVIGLFSLTAWIMLFSAGLMVDSLPYRQHLAKPSEWTWTYFFVAACVYTYTNVAILTCLSGVIGGVSSRLTFQWYQRDIEIRDAPGEADSSMDNLSIAYRVESPVASMSRSFLIYLLYIAGLAIGIPGASELSADQLPPPGAHTTFGQYLRMAGLLSLLGFIVGYDPTLFRAFLSRIPSPTRRKTGD